MLVEFRTDPLRFGPEWMRLYPILEEANMVYTYAVNTTVQQFGEPLCSIRAMLLDFFVDVDVSYIRLISAIRNICPAYLRKYLERNINNNNNISL